MQAVLLRALEAKCVRRVGSDRTTRTDFRLITTTQADLVERASRGEFREDLYYRLAGLKINVAPLRSRRVDIVEIAIAEAKALGGRVTKKAVERLCRCEWPGNVRQLINVVRSVHALGATCIDVVDLEGFIDVAQPRRPAHEADVMESALRCSREPVGASYLADVTGVSIRTAQRQLARLIGRGIARRIGAGRATRYVMS
jgi:DNA-binding NtrC family response regulator